MDLFRQDLRHAWRRLTSSPGFTFVAVLSLAIGIGANTAIFSIVNAVLLRPLPVERSDRLVDIFTKDDESEIDGPSSYPDYLDVRALDGVFQDVMAYELGFAPVELGDAPPEMVVNELVTANYFRVLGIRPALGRDFLDEENAPGAAPVVVLGNGYWRRAFGADPAVLGQTVRMGSGDYTVVGVAPASFAGMLRGITPDMYVPWVHCDAMKGDQERMERRGSHGLFVKGRLREGVTPAAAQSAVRDLSTRLAATYPETNEGRPMSAIPTDDVAFLPIVDRVITPVAALLLGLVALVLLIACANLAGFLLARAADRRKEIAVRLALGAKRNQLVRQLLVESTMLALLGGAAGLALGWFAVKALVSFQPPLPIPVRLDIPLDTRVLLFTLGISFAAGLAFGLLPALQATSPDVAPTLRDESGGSTGTRTRAALRQGLVVAQVAISMLLLVGAGLFVRSLLAATDVDPGFDTGPAGIVTPALEMIGYDDAREHDFYDRLTERVAALPGVTGVALADRLPVGANVQTRWVNFDGVQPPAGQDAFSIDNTTVDGHYFEVMGVPIVAGRAFTSADGPGAPRVVIVSEALARRFYPDGDAVGRLLYLGRTTESPATIIGIAKDTKVRTLGEAPRPYVYASARQSGIGSLQVVTRGTLPPAQLIDGIRRIARELEPRVPIMETKTMEQHLAVMMFAPRMGALLFAVFGGLGLVLATVGVWGTVSYAVARRTREVGIRMALGSTAREAVMLMTSSGARLVAFGAVAGIGLALVASRFMAGFLFGIDAMDPLTFVAVPVLLASIGVLAAWLPARRVASIDPMRALRQD